MTSDTRPLSPHLQVYRRTYNMVLSVLLHRAAGVVLSAGFIALTVWLAALAAGRASYAEFAALAASTPGRIALAGVAAAFWFHFCTGLRHLAFDTGRGLERHAARRSALVAVLAALVLTALTLAAIFAPGGAA
jgi:succinate dehydrogenase / fumarate reductase cytochrome b subunit